MKITWFGQAGLLLQGAGITVMIDPYLSDSVAALQPENHRRQPVDERFFAVQPDVLVLTHDHRDHYDPETVARFVGADTAVTVLAPSSVWPQVRRIGGAGNNYVLFDRQTVWSERGWRFTAVPAQHSDPAAIGVVIEAEGRTLYVTGDTLYSHAIFGALPEKIDAVFLPINGRGNNMNIPDAEAFIRRCGAAKAVPLHFGLFDEVRGEDLPGENVVVPKIWQEVKL